MSLLNLRRILLLCLFPVASALPGSSQATPLHFAPATSLISPSVGGDRSPSLSSDNLTLFFTSNARPGGHGSYDIWTATRPTTVGLFGSAVNLGIVNSSSLDADSHDSLDGLSLVFQSGRPGGVGGQDLWVSNRASIADSWGTPVNLGAGVNSVNSEGSPDISADGLTLLFASDRLGSFGSWDLYMATRPTASVPFGAAVNLGSTLNTSVTDYYPSLSADGLALFFSSNRAGGFGGFDLWVSTRASIADSWLAPVNLGPNVNSPFDEEAGDIAWDGSSIVFGSTRDGGAFHLYQALIVPEPSTFALAACGFLLAGLATQRRVKKTRMGADLQPGYQPKCPL